MNSLIAKRIEYIFICILLRIQSLVGRWVAIALWGWRVPSVLLRGIGLLRQVASIGIALRRRVGIAVPAVVLGRGIALRWRLLIMLRRGIALTIIIVLLLRRRIALTIIILLLLRRRIAMLGRSRIALTIIIIFLRWGFFGRLVIQFRISA